MCEGRARSTSHLARGTTDEPTAVVPGLLAFCQGKMLAGEDAPGALKALATTRMLLLASGSCTDAARGAARGAGRATAGVVGCGTAAGPVAGVGLLLCGEGASSAAGRRCDSVRKLAMLSMLGWSKACIWKRAEDGIYGLGHANPLG
jgi:hypothetical protein